MNDVFTAYLGLGSNLGDRTASLTEAVDHLRRHININVDVQDGVSSIFKTSPVDVPDKQLDYYNAALRIETSLTPAELLQACSKIENQMGRIRQHHNGSRVIDIDLLLFEDVVMETDLLTLPHPRMHERLFVLIPLCEIAADTLYPTITSAPHSVTNSTSSKSVRSLHDAQILRNENEPDSQQREYVKRIHPPGWFQRKDEIATKV